MSELRADLPDHLLPVYRAKPDWIQREIRQSEAVVLAQEIAQSGATSAIEIGVASGFSSSVLLSSLRHNSPTATLSAYDLAESCYFDTGKKTGQAVAEIFPDQIGYTLTTGITSADIPPSHPLVDFIFIDAGHRHPWPTLDLLSLHRFIRPQGWFGLHDVNMPLQTKNGYRQNGPRDLIRMWIGNKRIYKIAPNIGFVQAGTDADVFESIIRSLLIDWDTKIEDGLLKKYLRMAERFGGNAMGRLEKVFAEKKGSKARTELIKL